jgi:hypothetical protein
MLVEECELRHARLTNAKEFEKKKKRIFLFVTTNKNEQFELLNRNQFFFPIGEKKSTTFIINVKMKTF